jgi:iron uptake system EfeUOB component EfeO/EfeM
MKNLIFILFILFTIGCKSSKKIIENDIEETVVQKETEVINKGLSSTFSVSQLLSNEFIITRYEPIYIKLGGKDTVILKETVYRQINTRTTEEKKKDSDTTKINKTTELNTQFTDNSKKETEYKGYDFIKSITIGILSVLVIVLLFLQLKKKFFI